MRLTQVQTETIKRISAEVFGADVRLKLFGSRVDDSRYGGDIDLYVTGYNHSVDHQVKARLLFLVKVKRAIGEQRIDVVFAPLLGEPIMPIQKIAEETGILL